MSDSKIKMVAPPEGVTGEGFFATKLNDVVGMARANSLWPLPFCGRVFFSPFAPVLQCVFLPLLQQGGPASPQPTPPKKPNGKADQCCVSCGEIPVGAQCKNHSIGPRKKTSNIKCLRVKAH